MFRTAVWEAGQVIERAEQGAGDRRRSFDAQVARLSVGAAGQIQIESLIGIVLGQRGGVAGGLLQAMRHNLHRHLDSVGFGIGEGFR